MAAASAVVLGGLLGFWYLAYAYWLAVGLDSGLLEYRAWYALFSPGIWSVYLLGSGRAAAVAWTILGAALGLGTAALALRLRRRAPADDAAGA